MCTVEHGEAGVILVHILWENQNKNMSGKKEFHSVMYVSFTT